MLNENESDKTLTALLKHAATYNIPLSDDDEVSPADVVFFPDEKHRLQGIFSKAMQKNNTYLVEYLAQYDISCSLADCKHIEGYYYVTVIPTPEIDGKRITYSTSTGKSDMVPILVIGSHIAPSPVDVRSSIINVIPLQSKDGQKTYTLRMARRPTR